MSVYPAGMLATSPYQAFYSRPYGVSPLAGRAGMGFPGGPGAGVRVGNGAYAFPNAGVSSMSQQNSAFPAAPQAGAAFPITPPQVSSGFPVAATQPLSLPQIQQSLGGALLNASRVPIKVEKLYGLSDGAAALPGQRGSRLPATGVAELDRPLQWAQNAVMVTPSVLGTVGARIATGTLLGAGVGMSFATAVGSLLKAFKQTQSEWKPLLISTTLLGSLLGSVLGGIIGVGIGMRDGWRNLKDWASAA